MIFLLDAYLKWLQENGKSQNTIYNYHLAIEGYFKWFQGTYDKEPQMIYAQNIRDFIQYLRTIKIKSARTINARISALHSLNEYLVEVGIQPDIVITKNYMIKIQQQYASPAQFEKNEINKFMQIIVESENKRDYALVTLLAYTGCRISEALNIKISSDLFLEARELIIRIGKGDKQRTVLLCDKVVEAIKDYLKERSKHPYADSPFLFVSNKGIRLNRITVNDMFNKYCQKAGLRNAISPHDLRHFFCSNALESGFDVHEVAHIAGHSNIHTTLLYTNPSRQKMLDKLNRL